MRRDEKDTRKVPFFARYLTGQENAADGAENPSNSSATKAMKRTLKFPSDWDEWDTV
jgi:hypothetical protein